MATEWNHPMFGTGGSYVALQDKQVFQTLTRLAFSYSQVGDFYVKVLSYYNWTDVSVMYQGAGTRVQALYNLNRFVSESVHAKLIEAGLRSTMVISNSDSESELVEILQRASRVSRVFLITCDNFTLRKLMLIAHSMGMTNGDYVFLYFFGFNGFANGEVNWKMGDENDEIVRKVFQSLFLVGVFQSEAKEYQEFKSHSVRRSLEIYNYSYGVEEDINPYAFAFYTAFTLYGEVLKDIIRDGKDFRDGKEITKRLWNKTFNGVSRNISVNANGDVHTDMMILDMNPETGKFVRVGYGAFGEFHLSNSNTIHWPNNKGPPANKPPCGFTGEAPECFNMEDNPLVQAFSIAFSIIILIFGITVLTVYRKMKKDAELFSNWWKIPWKDITWCSFCQSKFSTLCASEAKLKSMSDGGSLCGRPMDNKVALYKGSKVHLFEFTKKSFSTNRTLFLELLQLRDVNCTNLTKFIGLTESASNQPYAVTEFCSRGDLRDILARDSFKLNKEFRISLIRDIIQAMEYIHTSSIQYHGNLTSRNCVIDSRFVLKVTDFGIQSLRDFEVDERSEKCLWAAPELLRKSVTKTDITGMQCADIYSFGILLYEVLSRKEPFEDDRDFLTLDEVITKLKHVNHTPFRPRLDFVKINKDIDRLMKMCWEEDPKLRPSFLAIRKESRKLRWDRSGDKLLDTLLSRMEKYADNLEGLVEERTQNLIEEKRKSEELLCEVLPRSVVNTLMSGRVVEPEAYTCVTIYFSDIVGFTEISSESTPMQIVDLLNDLYTCFDKIIGNFDVYKVETIGDAYMVVSGLPVRNGDQHVVEIAKMSCSILQKVNVFKIRHKPNTPLSARIGIHSGPVCAGVVGRKMPRYCLFGDTVNTASRMESNGQAMKIHCSENTRNLLVGHHEFVMQDRGNLQIKGKGVMRTYWLCCEIEDVSDNVTNV
ncbi:atrial natriuretic peptide receptor 1-like [Ostrea edulis]|uniref:atrial natriuretic peptide receptor 1-like n=1 Tax=Ostrea edulis TaxID=37623 RepID=UPI0024AF6067|nr:atrial natriuretic peptide receptor 1-like [Ostrea edulis]